jgi:Protein of unknown function (DUF3363)
MAKLPDEKPFRLRPRPPKGSPNDDPPMYGGALGSLLRLVQMSRRRRRGASGLVARQHRVFSQRVAVRVTYAKNKTPGQWKAHGRYLARESATQAKDPLHAGFDAANTGLPVASLLARWQRAADERFFKIIVSAEFGERLDLQQHTRRLLDRMEKDLARALEWVAVAHYNTEHPHVHIALRGRDRNGAMLRLERDYIRSGIRRHAEDLATEVLGYRTERDAQEARNREVYASRFTSLDRMIQKSQGGQVPSFAVSTRVSGSVLSESQRIIQQQLTARLAHLEKMGLAQCTRSQRWEVASDFESVLRTMQKAADRQRLLAVHGAAVSDSRLPCEITTLRSRKTLEGRVLVHAEEETTGRVYLLLEGTEGKLHLIYHTEEIEAARRRGELAIDSFVSFQTTFYQGRSRLTVTDRGDAQMLLKDRSHFAQRARSLLRRAISNTATPWGGWLGQYQSVLQAALEDIRERQGERSPQKGPSRR